MQTSKCAGGRSILAPNTQNRIAVVPNDFCFSKKPHILLSCITGFIWAECKQVWEEGAKAYGAPVVELA